MYATLPLELDSEANSSVMIVLTIAPLLTLLLLPFLPLVAAADWWTVEWDAAEFTAMSGDMVVPNLPSPGGTPYVWPGLQDGNGVLQAVLDGRWCHFPLRRGLDSI